MNRKDGFKIHSLLIRKDYLQKIKEKAYWDRKTQKEILDEALNQYLKNKKIKPIPGGK
jgi:hypothetical protein